MSAGKASSWWEQHSAQPAAGIAQRIVVVTDVHATAPTEGMRSLPEAQAAVDFLAARGIPLVVNSSRTRAEVERLHQTLQIRTPFISERGGALFLPHGYFPFVPARARPAVGCDVVEFGGRYHEVVNALRLTCHELKLDVVGFGELSIHQVARELGVPLPEAQLAKLREYTELFRIVDETDLTKRRLFKALHQGGLRCCPAGSRYLVTATADRADSLRTLRAVWGQAWGDPLMIGLGDSDDLEWLRHVDVAVIVPSAETRVISACVLQAALGAHREIARASWLVRGDLRASQRPYATARSDSAGERRAGALVFVGPREEWRNNMLEVPRDFFSRSSMSLVGWLLVAVCVLAAYELWDVAIKRWLG